MSEWAIELMDLTKSFDQHIVVDHLSLKIRKGEIFGFLGSNGSGKTTTIRMICGLLTPTSGQGTCLGYDMLSQQAQIKRHIGYMPQKFSFYTGLTVAQNLRFITDIYQLADATNKIKYMINELALDPYCDIKAVHLSGGWRQRLALACCLIHEPQLLCLDEPTAGVDPKARKEFWDYLHKIAHQSGTTILVTTHYMDEIEKCTDLAYIHLGHLLYHGSIQDLITFSQLTSLIIKCNQIEQAKLFVQLKHKYPDLMFSIINNELHVSSKDLSQLEQLKHMYPTYSYQACLPTYEEIFIGLIQ